MTDQKKSDQTTSSEKPWGGRFSDAQINAIIAYLRSLQPTAPTITQSQ